MDLLSDLTFNLIVFDDESATRVLSIWRLRVVSCEKVVANTKLGVESELVIKLTKEVCAGTLPLVVYSEDERVVKATVPIKTADGGSSFRLKILPNFINTKVFHLKILNGKTK
jgi:hypothetical protein